MKRDQAKALLTRYAEGTCSPEEAAQVEAWYHRIAKQQGDPLTDADYAFLYVQAYERLKQALPSSQLTEKPQRMLRWLPYAAAVLLAVTAATWIFYSNQIVHRESKIVNAEDIIPGTNRATLTLSDGRTIDLSEAQAGIIVGDENITYSDGSEIALNPAGGKLEKTEELVLITPKGGTYQVLLPDGSRVWLNANSTLKYPSRFSGEERIVYLEGEAYFSVSKIWKGAAKQNIPFKVLYAGQVVEVLGTEFNISSYPDEPQIKTTLVAGSVRVTSTAGTSAPLVLVPGEQSIMAGDGVLNKTKANLTKELAWKSGIFYFDETSFAELMRQAGRWYDIDIHYVGDVPQASFNGVMSRQVSLKTLLEYLGESTTKFTLAGRALTIHSETH